MILSVVSVLMLASVAVFFNASKVPSSSSGKYKYFGEGASSVVSAGETIYRGNEMLCPGGESAEDFYEEEMKTRLSECLILDSNSGRKRKLSHIEVNAIATFLKTL